MLAPPGEQLVHVRLVADVEEKVVGGRVENIVQRDGQFHHTEVGAKMPASAGQHRDEFAANLFGKLNQLGQR